MSENDPNTVGNWNREEKLPVFQAKYINFIFTLSLLTVFLTFIQTSVLKDNCHILDTCSSRRMQSGEDPRWFWAFPSRRKYLSALPEDCWWVLDILRCSVWAGTGSVLWDEPAGWTLQCVPLGSHLYHGYSQVRKHYICQSLVFLKFGFPDLTHDSDKRNSGCSDDTSQGLDSWWSSHNLPWFGIAEHSLCSGLSE